MVNQKQKRSVDFVHFELDNERFLEVKLTKRQSEKLTNDLKQAMRN